ncbi:unnamed protein product, partial [Ectocarpus sp. 8 AP-2014]
LHCCRPVFSNSSLVSFGGLSTIMDADKRLLQEVQNGNLQGVDEALAGGANVNGSSRLSCRPLTCAARWGNCEIAERLIEKRANLELVVTDETGFGGINPFYPVGSNALHAAVSFGVEVGMIRVLLDGGANPDAQDIDGCTALANACSILDPDERLAMVRELLRGGATAFTKTFKGTSPAHFAASKGDCRLLELLLSEAPAMVNHVNDDFGTPMAFAASTGQDKAVSFLVSAGASDEAVLSHERGSLFMALCRGFTDVVGVLLSSPEALKAAGGYDEIRHAMCWAMQQGQPESLRLLIRVGSKARYWSNQLVLVPGRLSDNQVEVPALQCAVCYQCVESTKLLLEAGADERFLTNHKPADLLGAVGLLLDAEDRDPQKAAEIVRVLRRAPAFRARSWRWPEATGTPVDAGSDPGDDAAAPLGAQIFWPAGRNFFTKRFEK